MSANSIAHLLIVPGRDISARSTKRVMPVMSSYGWITAPYTPLSLPRCRIFIASCRSPGWSPNPSRIRRLCATLFLDTPHIIVDDLELKFIEDTIDNMVAQDVFESFFTRVTEDEVADAKVRCQDPASSRHKRSRKPSLKKCSSSLTTERRAPYRNWHISPIICAAVGRGSRRCLQTLPPLVRPAQFTTLAPVYGLQSSQ